MKNSEKLTIGVLARKTGVGVETIRFYERKGLIRQPNKMSGGYRQYNEEDAKKIIFIKKTQNLGFTLKEILEILKLNTNSYNTCSEIKTKTDRKLVEIESKIKDLQKIKRALVELACACGESKQAVNQCNIYYCFEQNRKCNS